MPSWFDFSVKIWPKRFENAPKSAQGTDQEPPEKRPRGILEPTWAQMFSVFEQSWHKIKDLADLDAILVPFLNQNLTKTLPRWSQVGPRHRARAAQEEYSSQFGLKWHSNSEQLCTMNLPRIWMQVWSSFWSAFRPILSGTDKDAKRRREALNFVQKLWQKWTQAS